MTRDEIVSYVTAATGYLQPDDVTACQTFVVARDRLIYDSALWKSSLVLCTVAVDPVGNLDHAAGLVLLPAVVKRPVAIRINSDSSTGVTGNLGGSLRVQGLESYFRVDWDKFALQGTPYEFAVLNPMWLTARAGAGGSVTLSWASPSLDSGISVKVVWRDSSGNRFTNTNVLPMTLPPAVDGITIIEAVFHALAQDSTYLSITGGAVLGTLASVTRSPAYVQVRLIPKPTGTMSLMVLGKATYDALTFATQEPAILNSENLLIALTRADMLRRGGENGEAQAALGEASVLMQQLKDVELYQEASYKQIIPESGYGPDWHCRVDSWLRPGY